MTSWPTSLEHARLIGATIVGGSSFPQAKLVKANFGQGKLRNLDLSGADLRGVRGLGDNA